MESEPDSYFFVFLFSIAILTLIMLSLSSLFMSLQSSHVSFLYELQIEKLFRVSVYLWYFKFSNFQGWYSFTSVVFEQTLVISYDSEVLLFSSVYLQIFKSSKIVHICFVIDSISLKVYLIWGIIYLCLLSL